MLTLFLGRNDAGKIYAVLKLYKSNIAKYNLPKKLSFGRGKQGL